MVYNSPSKKKLLAIIVGILAFSTGCAATTSEGGVAPVDPYESINRPVYSFNSKVDNYLAKPIADGYRFITPDFMQSGVRNFFNNLQDVGVVLNDILQAKFEQGLHDFGRLGMNTTLGLMGMFDVASDVGFEKHNEDFGQTLAVWGVPQGSYLVLPFLGPTTMRELPGYVVDAAANPGTYVGVAAPLAGLGLLNARANAEGALQFVNEAALDPYVFTREAFLQWRNYQASDGKVDASQGIDDIEGDVIADPQTDKAHAASGSSKAPVVGTTPTEVKPVKPKNTYTDARKAFEEADAKLRALKSKK